MAKCRSVAFKQVSKNNQVANTCCSVYVMGLHNPNGNMRNEMQPFLTI